MESDLQYSGTCPHKLTAFGCTKGMKKLATVSFLPTLSSKRPYQNCALSDTCAIKVSSVTLTRNLYKIV